VSKFHCLVRVTLFSTLAALAACGFQLRGTGGLEVPEEWLQMHLVTGNPNSELAREVRNQFAAQGVNWVERDQANYLLRLENEQVSQRNLSLNAQARAAEIELTMKTRFTVIGPGGEEAIPQTEATIIKQMENDPANIVGKEEEARLLKQEMRVELARQILRRIAFFASASP